MDRLLVYCPAASDSARALVMGLRESGLNVRRLRKVMPTGGWRKGDEVLCWGMSHPRPGTFNSAAPMTKLEELTRLAEKGIMVPPFSNTPVRDWLPRHLHHQEGKDLLQGTQHPGFWTKKLPIRQEYRVHVVNGLSIRVGQKRVRPGHENSRHPWVRSYGGGWGIYYDAAAKEQFKKAGRELAKRAVEILGLQAAAVDLWLLEDGKWVVGEVNRRPALEGGVLKEYVKAVRVLTGVDAIPREKAA